MQVVILEADECKDHVKAATGLSDAPVSVLFKAGSVGMFVRQLVLEGTPLAASSTHFNTPHHLLPRL